MPLTSNAFTFHDNSNSEISTSPDLISARPRRSTRSSSNAKLVFHFPAQTDATGMADGTRPLTVTAGRKSKPMRRRAAASNIDSDADDDLVSLIQNQNGHSRTVALPTRSRHKKAHSKSKSKDLAVDIAAANKAAMKTSRAARANGSGMGAIKEHVTDWEIPRKVLHSSIGQLSSLVIRSRPRSLMFPRFSNDISLHVSNLAYSCNICSLLRPHRHRTWRLPAFKMAGTGERFCTFV